MTHLYTNWSNFRKILTKITRFFYKFLKHQILHRIRCHKTDFATHICSASSYRVFLLSTPFPWTWMYLMIMCIAYNKIITDIWGEMLIWKILVKAKIKDKGELEHKIISCKITKTQIRWRPESNQHWILSSLCWNEPLWSASGVYIKSRIHVPNDSEWQIRRDIFFLTGSAKWQLQCEKSFSMIWVLVYSFCISGAKP